MADEDMNNGAPLKPGAAPATALKILAREKPNQRWSSHFLNKYLSVPIKPIFRSDNTVFTIGSCFAERIRIALAAQGIKVGPRLQDVPLDPENYRIDALPTRPHMNYYNSFTIKQEFERHHGEWKQDQDDYWTHAKGKIWGDDPVYQDPYRRAIFGRSPEALGKAVAAVDFAMDRGIREADVFFITLGMAEVFRNKHSGKIACQKPGYAGGAGADETEFHMSSYEENLENMERVVEMIGRVNPAARIVTTVSPVGLSRTFQENDIISANTEGKSILRAVLGALARRHDQVHYFPSYEIVMANAPASFREDDGRHVADWVVSRIVDTFKAAHLDDSAPPSISPVTSAAE